MIVYYCDIIQGMSGHEGSPKRRRDNDSDIQFKVIIVGDSGVGKSCFLARYIKGIFVEEHHVTLGM
jgi:GTPase SAR1 family protein